MTEPLLGKKRKTRTIKVGDISLGGNEPLVLQSMCATRTTDIEATKKHIELLRDAGADLIRVAADGRRDVAALKTIARETKARLVVDLQESYRLAKEVAPFVVKFRYNPGHLHHHETSQSVPDKVKFLVDIAGAHNCALRIGVNCGSLDPIQREKGLSRIEAALRSALEHAAIVDSLGFKNCVVSIKSSNPAEVVKANKLFSERCPDIPLHLGVTEAGMLPAGERKTRAAFERLLSEGIGDTLRVSLTLPINEKYKEIEVAKAIIRDVNLGRLRYPNFESEPGLNIISCPSCSRVENLAFVELAAKVKEALAFAAEHKITIAVMGCRVNGPGETDEADLGLWCAPTFVNLKRGSFVIGQFKYDEVVDKVIEEVNRLISER